MDQKWHFDQELARRREWLSAGGYDSYCLFCMTGNEVRLARELNELHEGCLALPFLRMMHKSRNGVRYLGEDVLLKGYVFLYLPSGTDIRSVRFVKTAFRVLECEREEPYLVGSDRAYSEWILSLGGIVEVSRALRLGERVKIVGGPLLDIEGSIVAYSKKNRNCRVEIDMFGHKLNAWLPFDWVEPNISPMKYIAPNSDDAEAINEQAV